MSTAPRQLLITCEHGGNRVPAPYQQRFAAHRKLLESHRGYDRGALELARDFAAALDAPLFASTTTRLLVELNRSLGHPQLFSIVTRGLSRDERQRLLEQYYYPYRSGVEQRIEDEIAKGAAVVHLSVHSFTPVLDGQERSADIGLLYDPRRTTEKSLCRAWQDELRRERPDLRVRRNYPYQGVADGFTTYLRRKFPPESYAGVELEVNQAWRKNRPGWERLRASIIRTFAAVWR